MPSWRYLAGGGKHCEMVHHRRAGKDDLSLHWTAVSAFQKVGNYWHMLPKANQARKALWEAVNPHSGKRRIDEAFPKEIRASVNDHEMMIRFVNGSTWQVVGSDNFDSLVGSPPIGLVFSEWALCDPSSWAYLMPVIEENGGWVIFNTTPRGRNHAFRSVREAMRDPMMFGEILSAESTNVFTEDQLRRIKNNLIANYGPDYGASLYEQEYLCSFDAANLGAILGRWLVRAQTQGRIRDGVFDPEGAGVEISSDIGFRDTAAWWYWQPRSDGFGLVHYDSDSGLEAKEWIKRLKADVAKHKFKLSRIWLPHDAKAKTFATSHSPMEQFLEAFGSDIVRVVPRSDKFDRINAARTVIEKCWFENEGTREGRDALAEWKFVYDEERKEFSKEPDHSWASHGSDAFSYGCQVMQQRELEEKVSREDKFEVKALAGGGFSLGVSLNDLWAMAKPKGARI
jgi:phage terminase large subunit